MSARVQSADSQPHKIEPSDSSVNFQDVASISHAPTYTTHSQLPRTHSALYPSSKPAISTEESLWRITPEDTDVSDSQSDSEHVRTSDDPHLVVGAQGLRKLDVTTASPQEIKDYVRFLTRFQGQSSPMALLANARAFRQVSTMHSYGDETRMMDPGILPFPGPTFMRRAHFWTPLPVRSLRSSEASPNILLVGGHMGGIDDQFAPFQCFGFGTISCFRSS